MDVNNIENTEVSAADARDAVMDRVLSAYFKTPRDQLLEAEVDWLLDSYQRVHSRRAEGKSRVGRLAEGRIVSVLGESGAGKTRSLQRLFASRRELADLEKGGSSITVIAPSPCTLKQLGNSFLAALGYELERDVRENVVWALVRQRLRDCRVRIVHIDELQHALKDGNAYELQKVRDTLKNIVQQKDWPVWLILSGLPMVAKFFQGDTQIKRRSRFVRFEPIEFPRDARMIDKMIRQFVVDRAGLSVDRENDEAIARLIHASLNQLGTAIEFTQDAIEEALRSGDGAVRIGHFARAYAARAGCGPDANVFIARDWHRIDPRMILDAADQANDDLDPEQLSKKPRDVRNK
ncbi:MULTISPECIES: ATP-binding protein [unclassified Mesorhizobium]|uniref:ATP-binding protein n=1 Tax=unclassified Mesorhizobium TaxID=325217 RepID=UPI0010934DC3|nr:MULTISPECIES: ATP-binding protein [unclassified Mesorhizobium]TGS46245.1 ATP-binding protein [Mesorhizobium sp. M8A.F.Ca.ET.182.01.1.1]TGS81702.1 ATP-binding protein [Mesorhizobium sp. M8A.F.Ca.ET.181.01.1.1]